MIVSERLTRKGVGASDDVDVRSGREAEEGEGEVEGGSWWRENAGVRGWGGGGGGN